MTRYRVTFRSRLGMCAFHVRAGNIVDAAKRFREAKGQDVKIVGIRPAPVGMRRAA